MNVEVQDLGPCKKLLRISVEAAEVEAATLSVVRDFQKQARMPGFRPGKAPLEMIRRTFARDIEAEVKKKLISDTYNRALKDHKLEPAGAPDIEEVKFGAGQPLSYVANVEIEPEIQLPEYKGMVLRREITAVTDADVERAVDLLRGKASTFEVVDRPASAGDVAVVSYTATTDGKPLTDLAPTAKGLTEQKAFWVEMRPNAFLPGFSEQITGMKAGERRAVSVAFPADFVPKALAGLKAEYAVEIVEVRERRLPDLDEALAKKWGAESVEKLREGVRRDLANELAFKQNRALRDQIVSKLLEKAAFDLPESIVAQETKRLAFDLVRENVQRGVPKDVLDKNREQIYNAALLNARDRIKTSYLLRRIAEVENIKVSEEEVTRRIMVLASMNNLAPQKLAQDLQKQGRLIEIYDQLSAEKTLDWLQANAKIEEVAPAAAPA